MITKRHLAYLFIAAGLGGLIALWVYDRLGAGDFAGVGPAQRLAMLGLGGLLLVGLTLLPLGDRPA